MPLYAPMTAHRAGLLAGLLTDLVADEMLPIWRLLGTLAGTLVLLLITLWAGKHITAQARGLWAALRSRQGAIIGALDEPTDPAVAQLVALTGIPARVWVAVLPAFVAALAQGLESAADSTAPPASPAAPTMPPDRSP